MAQGGIECPAAIVFMVPAHRVVVSVGPTLICAFIHGDQYVNIGVQFFKIVHLIRTVPDRIGKKLSGRKIPVLYNKISFRSPCRMALKITSYQFAVPVPVIFGIRRRVYANKSTAGLHITLKGRFLLKIKDVSRSVQKNYRRILF